MADLSDVDRARWRALLVHHPDTAPFVDEAWVAAWIQGFEPRQPLLACLWDEDALVGLGALQRVTESWAGRRVAVLQSLTNVESPRFEFLSAYCRHDVQERLCRGLCEAGGCDVIRLEYLPEHSPTLRAATQVAGERGWKHVIEETFESPWRSLRRPPAAWDEGLHRKFKANLRNRERRLHELGEVTFTVVRDGPAQHAALELFYALEASSWKGARGSAIRQRARARTFYDALAALTAGETWIPTLSVSGRTVAAQLIRAHGRTLFMLKTAYDPAFAPYAPGQLLTGRVMRYGGEQGFDALDFLGENMVWKSDWAPRLRRHYCLLLFSPSARGRYAYWTRHGLRAQLKKIPYARQVVRWLRARWARQ
ncbi:MAG TPA: GNAT family N-acetyltransferase [Gemmatimonadales bacterium]|nr:GNAT family N-acetyltransferase [Gemmatimonadales bacterium]